MTTNSDRAAASAGPGGGPAESAGALRAADTTESAALATLIAKSGAENFPVASRVLPKALRRDLMALYTYARFIDDIGDESDGADTISPEERLRNLDAAEADLERIWTGEPEWPVMRRLAATVRAHDIPDEPFRRLIEANRIDQRVTRYESYEQLIDYCAYSATPVGQVVLYITEQVTPRRIAWSDQICTALQLLEHSQDVAEDFRRDRVYLPATELDDAGITQDMLAAELTADQTSPRLRMAVAGMVGRASGLLSAGAPLVAELRGVARWAVAGYFAGGRATAHALGKADYDVLRKVPRPGRWRTLAGTVRLTIKHGQRGGGAA